MARATLKPTPTTAMTMTMMKNDYEININFIELPNVQRNGKQC